jgi:cell division protein FtsW (lipid II flippase)
MHVDPSRGEVNTGWSVVVEASSNPSSAALVRKIAQRRIVQWAIAYILAAWVVLQVAQSLADIFALPIDSLRALVVLLIFGFSATLVLAWYHGEKGRQNLSISEIVLLSIIVVMSAFVLATVELNIGECKSVYPAEGGSQNLNESSETR